MDNIASLQKSEQLSEYEEEFKAKRLSSEQLNEDMEKIFENQADEDFSIAKLTDSSEPWSPGYEDDTQTAARDTEGSRFRDLDIKFHRSDSFPHVHHPLKPQHHRVRKRSHRTSISEDVPTPYTKLDNEEQQSDKNEEEGVRFQIGDPEVQEDWSVGNKSEAETQESKPSQPASPKSPTKSPSKTFYLPESADDEEKSPLLGDDEKPPRPIIRSAESERVQMVDETSRKKSRVQFDIGEAEEQQDSDHTKERPRRRRSHKRREREHAEDPSWRKHPGSEHNLRSHRSFATTEEEEAKNLGEHDLDEMSSHRFDDPSGYIKPRVRARSSVSSIIHMSDNAEKTGKQLPIMKKSYDHSPHEVFVELDELKYINGHLEWKETARWIKYEEDVEDVDNRWGKPHLAFLNFHALFSLRKGLDSGAVLLDLEERDLPSIAARVVDKMIACDQIPPDQRDAVIRVLLLRHRHIRDNHSSFRLPSRGSKNALASSDEKLATSPTSLSLDGGSSLRASVRKAGLSNLFHVNTFAGFRRQNTEDNITSNGNVTKEQSQDKKGVNREESYTQIDIEDLSPKEREARESARKNSELMKKIPEGAEATAVLVGAVDFLKQPTIAFVRLAEGVMMDNLVEVPIPVRFMFVLLGPFHGEMDYHEVGRSISTLMSDKGFHEVAYRAHSRGQLLSAINEFLNASIVLPPSDWNNKDLVPVDDIRAKANQIMKKKESMRARKQSEQGAAVAPVSAGDGDGGDRKPPPRDPLIRHGKPFYGLIQDIKIRYPRYLSDIKDGISGQVLASAFFIFFACLSAAITFGGMYGDQMDNFVGVGETLLLSMINGLLYALFACQPLIIVGATGPLMVFDFSLYKFCESNDIDFLSIRVWIGLWMTVATIVIAAFEGVVIVKKFTRFTEEIFSSLVCLIFIYEAIAKLVAIFIAHPLQANYGIMDSSNNSIVSGIIVNGTLFNGTDGNVTEIEDAAVSIEAQPNTALLSFILTIGTFIIAIKLKNFRNSKFLGRSIRRALGDFGVPISIVLMVSLDFLIKDTYTDKLTMPAGLSPSKPEVRGWLINPFGALEPLPVWCIFAAAPASLLLLILVFLEGNICHLILNKPEKNMVKGTGFHFDLVLFGVINFVSGIFGAPFMGPACVRTISHVAALTVMSTNQAPGESPKIQGVHEQRISGFIVSLLVGLAVFLTAALNLVPKAVLLGVFLYMGISATAGIQFVERSMLFLMPVKHHPNVPYVKKVRTWKMHAFTGSQLLLLGILWVVKQSPASLCFPFLLLLLIPIRLFLFPYVFTATELNALDGQEANAAMNDDGEPDFFEETHGLPTHINHVHQS